RHTPPPPHPHSFPTRRSSDLCVVMDGLIERNDVVIGVTFFAWNDPIRDGLQCTPHFPAVLAPRQRMFHPLLMRTRQLERESDLGVFVFVRSSNRVRPPNRSESTALAPSVS